MYTLPKTKKLLKSREFQTVLNSRVKFVLPEVVIFSKPNKLGTSRMGLVVTKKIGNAVTRNKIKRQLREVFRQSSCQKNSNRHDLDLVFIARAKSKSTSYEKLSESFEFALGHIEKRYKRNQETKHR